MGLNIECLCTHYVLSGHVDRDNLEPEMDGGSKACHHI